VLDWSCRYDLTDGLRETIDWYRRYLRAEPALSNKD
jgi:nucleoside-diphosphate-sugar epimerase